MPYKLLNGVWLKETKITVNEIDMDNQLGPSLTDLYRFQELSAEVIFQSILCIVR